MAKIIRETELDPNQLVCHITEILRKRPMENIPLSEIIPTLSNRPFHEGLIITNTQEIRKVLEEIRPSGVNLEKDETAWYDPM